jgi:hypothetical protein
MGKKRALETQVQFGGKLKLRTKERKLNLILEKNILEEKLFPTLSIF